MKSKCQFCEKKTEMPLMYYSMTPINEKFEKKINELGREDWWHKIDYDNATEEEDELVSYDQLINTISRSIVCKKCLNRDSKLWEKYYPQTSKENE
jgi:hypothetical protein